MVVVVRALESRGEREPLMLQLCKKKNKWKKKNPFTLLACCLGGDATE
jgi:hypothetical protein